MCWPVIFARPLSQGFTTTHFRSVLRELFSPHSHFIPVVICRVNKHSILRMSHKTVTITCCKLAKLTVQQRFDVKILLLPNYTSYS